MVALEVDGGVWVQGRHSGGVGFERDAEKMSEAAVLGWRVIRVTPAMVRSGAAAGFVERAVGGSTLKTTLAPAGRHLCRAPEGCATVIPSEYDICQFHRREGDERSDER